MFPLKLVRSLVSGDDVTTTTTTNPLLRRIHNLDDDNPTCCSSSRNRIPLMLFLPTQELVKDTYRLASIARFIGMDLHPNPSLSHIIFSWPPTPSPPPPPPSTSSSSSSSTSTSTSSSSSSWSLRNDSVPIPFPSFATSSLSHLRLFAALSNGYFKLAFLKTNNSIPFEKIESLSNNNRHRTSLSLFSTRTCDRIESMDRFNKALLGTGWTLFKTNNNNTDKDSLTSQVYLYRKSDARRRICNSNTKQPTTTTNRNRDDEECRVRELRLPTLDFGNAPLRILQYILLMTDDAFYLA
ncbi:hypothetical protein ACP275_08G088700 [Erythranthe tilingii]